MFRGTRANEARVSRPCIDAHLVVFEVRDDLLLDLALHLLADDRRALLEELLPQQHRPPQALVLVARAAAKLQRLLDRLGEARLLTERSLHVDQLVEERAKLLLRRRGILVSVRIGQLLDLRLEVRLARRRHRRVQDLQQLDAALDAVLPDVLDAVPGLLRHLLELIKVEDDL